MACSQSRKLTRLVTDEDCVAEPQLDQKHPTKNIKYQLLHCLLHTEVLAYIIIIIHL